MVTPAPYEPSASRYESMDYSRAGATGVLLPRLSLGLWQNFGDDRPFEAQNAILRAAFDAGITHFDLANNYGPPYGAAEANFGRHLARDFVPYRDELFISTKAGFDMWSGPYGDHGSRKYLLASLDRSLQRLGLDYVDVFYHHRPDPDTPLQETMGALAHAVTSGKALYVGLSNYDAAETLDAAEVLEALGVPLLLHQPKYSMLARDPEDGLFDLLEQRGIGAAIFSPLAQGMLTERYLTGVEPGSRASLERYLKSDQITDRHLERVRALQAVAVPRRQSVAQLALTWALRQPAVTTAVIGASSVGQLRENLAVLGAAPLAAAELGEIERALA